MTQMNLFQTAKSSPQDTHANPLVSPGLEEEQKTTDISGQKYFPLLKQNDPLGQFSKTFMATSLWVSMKCFLIWKGKATPQGRLLFQLLPLTHPTEGIEFGSSDEIWPTPIASTGGPYKNHKGDNKKVPSSGNPLATAVAMWPTPRARDWKMSGDVANWKESNIGDTCLRRAVAEQEESVGSLNPQWVEWLMGYPAEWTALED